MLCFHCCWCCYMENGWRNCQVIQAGKCSSLNAFNMGSLIKSKDLKTLPIWMRRNVDCISGDRPSYSIIFEILNSLAKFLFFKISLKILKYSLKFWKSFYRCKHLFLDPLKLVSEWTILQLSSKRTYPKLQNALTKICPYK